MEKDARNKEPIALALPQARSGAFVSGSPWSFPAAASTTPCLPAREREDQASTGLARFIPPSWRGGMLNFAVHRLDAFLRRQQNIFEFCDAPHCLLRVAVHPVEAGVILPSGYELRRGEFRGDLHLWNEHVPGLLATGADLLWAVLTRRRMRQSLALLAAAVQNDPRLDAAKVFCAETRLGAGKPRVQMERIAKFYGFELTDAPQPGNLQEHLSDLGERIHLCAMVRAFNPGALTMGHLIRTQRHQLWMSREVLLSKYAGLSARM